MDHALVQLNIGHLDENEIYTDAFSTFALCGFILAQYTRDFSILAAFLVHAAGFLLPVYVMAWAFSILQKRKERQEAAALAAS